MNYYELEPADVNYILIKTTDSGPFFDDLFFLIISQQGVWEIPISENPNFMNWLEKFPHISMKQFFEAMGSVQNRIFILYRGSDKPVLSEKKENELRERFTRLLQTHVGCSSEERMKIVERAFAEYQSPSRCYHNLEHIQCSLWELDRIDDKSLDRTSLEFAIWYHDLVYDPLSKDNEIRSAWRFRDEFKSLPIDIDLNVICKLICSTGTQFGAEGNAAFSLMQKYFLDIDYAVLGQSAIDYTVYRQNVALEYKRISKLLYCISRKAFLGSTLERGVYFTDWFKNTL